MEAKRERVAPYWFPQGPKVDTEEYLKVVRDVVKLWLDHQYPEGNYVWQQDSAPAQKFVEDSEVVQERAGRLLAMVNVAPLLP